MYDILQLNDMLVPELLDIAEQLNIPDAKKLDKKTLVYQILDNQAIAGSKNVATDAKPKRKRIVKTTTSNGTEEAFVEEDGDEEEVDEKKAKAPAKKETEDAEDKATTLILLNCFRGFLLVLFYRRINEIEGNCCYITNNAK